LNTAAAESSKKLQAIAIRSSLLVEQLIYDPKFEGLNTAAAESRKNCKQLPSEVAYW